MNVQFVFHGGLGNQLFQFFASKFISRNIPDLKINYALSKSILNGQRNFEADKLIKEKIHINSEYFQFGEKIYSKIIKNMPLITSTDKNKFKTNIDLLNSLYYEKKLDSFKSPLLKLEEDLIRLKKNFKKLKVKGFWQNPSSYIQKIDNYKSLLIDTKSLLPKNIVPNKYITRHIRRGDYLTMREFNNYFYNFSPVKHILLSLQLLPMEANSLPIYLITDDKKWARDLIFFLSNKSRNRFEVLETKNNFEDWSILRHSAINICSNSTFAYTAALLNYENVDKKMITESQNFEKNIKISKNK